MRSSNRGKADIKAQTPLIAEVDTSRIELVGVPGVRQSDGSFAVNQEVTQFFAELISKEVFSDTYDDCGCQFESLRVWLYDTSYVADLNEESFPEITKTSLQIPSPLKKSALTSVYVLDSGVRADEYDKWKAACYRLYTPLFQRFVPPPEPPDILKEFLEIRFGAELSNRLNMYLNMRKHLFFDALIIQMEHIVLDLYQD